MREPGRNDETDETKEKLVTQSHSRSKRVLPRHIIATLAISGASVAGMAAPSFAEEPTQPSDGTTAATPNANGTAGAAVNEALAKAQLANLPQGNGDAPRDGDDKRTPGDDGGQAGDQNGGNGNGGQGDNGNGGGDATPDPTPTTETPSPTPSTPSEDPTSPSPTDPSGQPSSGGPSAQDPKNQGDPSQPGAGSPSDNKVPGLNTGTPQKTGAENGGDHGVAPNQQDPGASVPVVPSPRAGSGQKGGVSGAQLPRTGASVTTLAAVAVAAAGTGGVLVARRRRAY